MKRFRPHMPRCALVAVLLATGATAGARMDLTTLQLAQRLETWMREGGDTAFVIGGADGIDDEIKMRADAMLRLSSLTLPHAMARLVLCEQLYRAMSVVRNHPYHREG